MPLHSTECLLIFHRQIECILAQTKQNCSGSSLSSKRRETKPPAGETTDLKFQRYSPSILQSEPGPRGLHPSCCCSLGSRRLYERASATAEGRHYRRHRRTSPVRSAGRPSEATGHRFLLRCEGDIALQRSAWPNPLITIFCQQELPVSCVSVILRCLTDASAALKTLSFEKNNHTWDLTRMVS